jgi:alkylhydroperoxidase family enzyme
VYRVGPNGRFAEEEESTMGDASESSDAGLAPLRADEWGDAQYDAFGALLGLAADDVPRAGSGRRFDPLHFDVVGVLVRSPGLAKVFLAFNAYLLQRSPLPARVRELCILRVAHQRRNAYEWAEHVTIGRGLGITDEEMDALAGGNDAFGGVDRLVLEATDELLAGHPLPSAMWDRLVAELGVEAAMDLLFVAGTYQMLAAAFDTWGLTPPLRSGPSRSGPSSHPGPRK